MKPAAADGVWRLWRLREGTEASWRWSVCLPGIYRGPSEGVVELGCAVESVGHQVGVDAEGDGGVGVAGDASDLEDVGALGDQLGDGEVAEVVEAGSA